MPVQHLDGVLDLAEQAVRETPSLAAFDSMRSHD
jgi:hypothetical protein